MRGLAVFAVALGALFVSPQARAADAEFSDVLCPTATAPVRQFNAMLKKPDTPAETVAGEAALAALTYDECGKQAQSDRKLDVLHYSMVQAAKMRVVQGRILIDLDETDSAKTVLTRARDGAAEVVNWRRSAQDVYRSNDENVGSGSTHNSDATGYSAYRNDALLVRDAAAAELAKLTATPSPTSTAKP